MQAIIEAKIDGISLLLKYVKGQLESAVTRGDGIVGDDITENASHVQGVAQTIPYTDHPVYIRGEVVMYEETFKKVYSELKKPDGSQRYKNARNTTSGMCKGKSDHKDLGNLNFIAYEIYGSARGWLLTESRVIETLKTWKFETPALVVTVTSSDEAEKVYLDYDQRGGREKIPYQTDGLVIKVNNIIDQNKYPTVGNRPSYCVAIKPTSKVAITRVLGVTWEMGLSGRFTPVAAVEPCDLDGTTNKRLNLFNLDFLTQWHQKGFGVGAIIRVRRTGDVLPYLDDVITPAPSKVG